MEKLTRHVLSMKATVEENNTMLTRLFEGQAGRPISSDDNVTVRKSATVDELQNFLATIPRYREHYVSVSNIP